MNSTTDAVIAIRWPSSMSQVRFVPHLVGGVDLEIDGHRAGKIKSGTTEEFKVEPGMHTGALSGWPVAWPVAKPSLQVSVEAGSTTKLVIHNTGWKALAKSILGPLFLIPVFAHAISERLLAMMALGNPSWWVDLGVKLLVAGAILTTYVLVTAALFPRYWAIFQLKAEETTSPAD